MKHHQYSETYDDMVYDWDDPQSRQEPFHIKGLTRKQERKFSSRKFRSKNKPRFNFD